MVVEQGEHPGGDDQQAQHETERGQQAEDAPGPQTHQAQDVLREVVLQVDRALLQPPAQEHAYRLGPALSLLGELGEGRP